LGLQVQTGKDQDYMNKQISDFHHITFDTMG